MYDFGVSKMRSHHSWVVVSGLHWQLHALLREQEPDGLQISVGCRDAQ